MQIRGELTARGLEAWVKGPVQAFLISFVLTFTKQTGSVRENVNFPLELKEHGAWTRGGSPSWEIQGDVLEKNTRRCNFTCLQMASGRRDTSSKTGFLGSEMVMTPSGSEAF